MWLFWQYNIFCTSLIPWAKLFSAKTSPSPRPSPPFLWLIPDTKSSGLHFLVRCPESAGVFWRSLNAISLSRLGIQPGCVQLQAWSFKPLSQWLNPPPSPTATHPRLGLNHQPLKRTHLLHHREMKQQQQQLYGITFVMYVANISSSCAEWSLQVCASQQSAL